MFMPWWQACSQRRQASAHSLQCAICEACFSHSSPQALQISAHSFSKWAACSEPRATKRAVMAQMSVAVAVEQGATGHHLRVVFLQAGGDAGIEGIEQGLVLGMNEKGK